MFVWRGRWWRLVNFAPFHGCHLHAESQEVIILKWIFVWGETGQGWWTAFHKAPPRAWRNNSKLCQGFFSGTNSCVHTLSHLFTYLFNPLFTDSLSYLCIHSTVIEQLHWARCFVWALGIKWCTQPHLSSPRWTEEWWKSGSQLSQGIRKVALLSINFCRLHVPQTRSCSRKLKAHLVSLTLLMVGRSILSTSDAWGPQPLLQSFGCKVAGSKSLFSPASFLDLVNLCIWSAF